MTTNTNTFTLTVFDTASANAILVAVQDLNLLDTYYVYLKQVNLMSTLSPSGKNYRLQISQPSQSGYTSILADSGIVVIPVPPSTTSGGTTYSNAISPGSGVSYAPTTPGLSWLDGTYTYPYPLVPIAGASNAVGTVCIGKVIGSGSVRPTFTLQANTGAGGIFENVTDSAVPTSFEFEITPGNDRSISVIFGTPSTVGGNIANPGIVNGVATLWYRANYANATTGYGAPPSNPVTIGPDSYTAVVEPSQNQFVPVGNDFALYVPQYPGNSGNNNGAGGAFTVQSSMVISVSPSWNLMSFGMGVGPTTVAYSASANFPASQMRSTTMDLFVLVPFNGPASTAVAVESITSSTGVVKPVSAYPSSAYNSFSYNGTTYTLTLVQNGATSNVQMRVAAGLTAGGSTTINEIRIIAVPSTTTFGPTQSLVYP